MKQLLTVMEATEETGLGRTKLYEEVGAGRLKAVKVGRRTLITGESLMAYIAGLPPARVAAPRKRGAA